MNDGIEAPLPPAYFDAQAQDGGWLSWNLNDKTRFNAFIEPLAVRPEAPLPDGRPRYGPVGGVASTNQDLLMTNSRRGRGIFGSLFHARLEGYTPYPAGLSCKQEGQH